MIAKSDINISGVKPDTECFSHILYYTARSSARGRAAYIQIFCVHTAIIVTTRHLCDVTSRYWEHQPPSRQCGAPQEDVQASLDAINIHLHRSVSRSARSYAQQQPIVNHHMLIF